MLPAACVSGTAISFMGVAAAPPVESTAVPAPRPSQRVYPEGVPVRGNALPEFNRASLSLCRTELSASVFIILRDALPASVFAALSTYPDFTPGFTPPKVSDARPSGQTLTYRFEVKNRRAVDESCKEEVQQ